MTRYTKKTGANLDKPDEIYVFKVKSMKTKDLEGAPFVRAGDLVFLNCRNGFDKSGRALLSKGDLVATGKNHVWVIDPGSLKKNYSKAK